MKHHEAGKGSRQRPGSGYADGWDAIWGKKMKQGEVWRPIPGYEGKYEVSSAGRVRKISGEFVSLYKNDQGYITIKVSGPRATLRVHRLVAKAFIPNPGNLKVVNHLDHDRSNNNAANLEWCTQAQNLEHADRAGRRQKDYWVGKRSPNAKLSNDQVKRLRVLHGGGLSYAQISTLFGISKRTVGRIVNRDVYRDVLPLPEPPESN